MKLRAKIKNKYMKQILSGRKTVEYRQIESMVLTDEDGNEYEFEVKDIENMTYYYFFLPELMEKYPDVPWKDDLPTIEIVLGERIK